MAMNAVGTSPCHQAAEISISCLGNHGPFGPMIFGQPQVDESWHEQVTHGLVAICDPVLTETLTIARATEYERVRTDLLQAYPWVPVPDRASEIVHSVQARLAAKSQHHGLSVTDHLVAMPLTG